MARKKIDDQLVAQCIRLHNKGESNISIGHKCGIDPRTVKSWIQKAGKEKEQEHWEAVCQQIDAKYLDEHYRLLLKIAAAVMEAADSDPIVTDPELAVPVFFNTCIRSATQRATKLLVERGLELASKGKIEWHAADRLGRKLLDALMEHEPVLKTTVEAWESDWIKFQQTRLDFARTAKDLFINATVGKTVAEGIKTYIANEVLRNKFLNEEPCLSRIDVSDKKNKRIRNKLIGDKLVRLVRYNKNGEVTVYTGSEEEAEVVCKIYDKVFLQLCHEERIRPVKDSYLSLMKRVKEVEDYVDRLILVGRPQGQCSLCLNRQTPPPSSEG